MSKKSGFTIIELLVVLSIIFFLSTVMVSVYGELKVQTRDTKRFAELQSLQKALEGFYAEKGYFPVCNSGLDGWCGVCNTSSYSDFQGVLSPLVQEEFIAQIPRDPMDPVSADINAQNNTGCQTYFYRTQTSLLDNGAFGTCGGQDVNDFSYVITFATEKAVSNYPKYEPGRIPSRSAGGEYCVIGPQIR